MWVKIKVPSNVRKNTVKKDVSTIQCDTGIIKCERKEIREPLMWQKYNYMWYWYYTIWE